MTSFWRQAAPGALVALMVVGCNEATNDTSDTSGGDTTTTSGGGDASELVGQLSVVERSLDFGSADCGGDAPASKEITLKNDGTGALHWVASLDSNVFFSLSGATSGTLEPGATTTLKVDAGSMPSMTTAGSIIEAAITIASDSGLSQIIVPAKATARGATFQLVSPSNANFGEVPGGKTSSPIAFKVRNVGNAPAKFAVGESSDPQFAFSWTGADEAVEVAAGANVPGLQATFTPTKNNVASGAADVSVTGAVCGESIDSLVAEGRGIVGTFGVSPGTVDLGKVGCQTAADPQLVTIYNSGSQVFFWNAQVLLGTNYTIAPKSGAVPPGGTSTLTVTPKNIGLTTKLADNEFGDNLVITTSLPSDTPHVVPIKQTASGAILKWQVPTLAYGTQPVFTASAAKEIVITNEGNADATVGAASTTPTFQSEKGVAKAGGGTFTAQLKYVPDNLGPQTTKVSIVSETPVCQALPAAATATGTGKGVAAAISLGGNGKSGGGEPGGCIILKDSGGKVACFGQNNYGELGTTNPNDRGPRILSGLPEVVKVSRGDDFACAVGKDGTVWCWGRNNNNGRNQRVGKLGQTGVDMSATPVQVPNITNAVDVSAGHQMACAVRSTGVVSCWGTNRRGNLGNGMNGVNLNATPQDVPGITTAKQVVANAGGGCALLTDGTARCWGRMRRSGLGNGSSGDGTYGVSQVNLSGITQLAGMPGNARNGNFRCGIYAGGNMACWGCRSWSRNGDGCSNNCRGHNYNPGGVSGITTSVAMGLYYDGGCSLMADKTIRCWGRNENGMVGQGNTSQYSTPVTVPGINDATGIGVGGRAACAIVTGGSVKCWGEYGSGNVLTPTTLTSF